MKTRFAYSWLLVGWLVGTSAFAEPPPTVTETNVPPALPSMFRLPAIQEVCARLIIRGRHAFQAR